MLLLEMNVPDIKKIFSCCQVWTSSKESSIMDFWDWKSVVMDDKFFNKYYQLKAVLLEKQTELVNRRYVFLHHDNAKPYVVLTLRQCLKQFYRAVLLHPFYSLDLDLTCFYFFLSLKNFLRCKYLEFLRLNTFCKRAY